MRSPFFKSLTSLVLILTSTVSWSAPAWALRPAARGDSKAGAEELRVALASDTTPAGAVTPALPVSKTPISIQPAVAMAAAGTEEAVGLDELLRQAQSGSKSDRIRAVTLLGRFFNAIEVERFPIISFGERRRVLPDLTPGTVNGALGVVLGGAFASGDKVLVDASAAATMRPTLETAFRISGWNWWNRMGEGIRDGVALDKQIPPMAEPLIFHLGWPTGETIVDPVDGTGRTSKGQDGGVNLIMVTPGIGRPIPDELRIEYVVYTGRRAEISLQRDSYEQIFEKVAAANRRVPREYEFWPLNRPHHQAIVDAARVSGIKDEKIRSYQDGSVQPALYMAAFPHRHIILGGRVGATEGKMIAAPLRNVRYADGGRVWMRARIISENSGYEVEEKRDGDGTVYYEPKLGPDDEPIRAKSLANGTKLSLKDIRLLREAGYTNHEIERIKDGSFELDIEDLAPAAGDAFVSYIADPMTDLKKTPLYDWGVPVRGVRKADGRVSVDTLEFTAQGAEIVRHTYPDRGLAVLVAQLGEQQRVINALLGLAAQKKDLDVRAAALQGLETFLPHALNVDLQKQVAQGLHGVATAGAEEKPVIGFLTKLTGKDAKLSEQLLAGNSWAKGEATKILNQGLGSVKEFDAAFGRLLVLSRGDMEVFASTFERAVAKPTVFAQVLSHLRRLAQDHGAPYDLPPVSYYNPARYVYARLRQEALNGFSREVLNSVASAVQSQAKGVDLDNIKEKAVLVDALRKQLGEGRLTSPSGLYRYKIHYDSLVQKEEELYLTVQLLLDGAKIFTYDHGVDLDLILAIPALSTAFSGVTFPRYRSPYPSFDLPDARAYTLSLLDPFHFINERFPEWKPQAEQDLYEARMAALDQTGEKRMSVRWSDRHGNLHETAEGFWQESLEEDVVAKEHEVATKSERQYGNSTGVTSQMKLDYSIVKRGGIGVTASRYHALQKTNPALAEKLVGRKLERVHELDHQRVEVVSSADAFAKDLQYFFLVQREAVSTGRKSGNLQDETKFKNLAARKAMLAARQQLAEFAKIDPADAAAVEKFAQGTAGQFNPQGAADQALKQAVLNARLRDLLNPATLKMLYQSVYRMLWINSHRALVNTYEVPAEEYAAWLPGALGFNWIRNLVLRHDVNTMGVKAGGVPFERWYIEPDHALDNEEFTPEEMAYLTFMAWNHAQAFGFQLGPVVPGQKSTHGARAEATNLDLGLVLKDAGQAATAYGQPLPADILKIARKAPAGTRKWLDVVLANKGFTDEGLKQEVPELLAKAGERTVEEENSYREFVLEQMQAIPSRIMNGLTLAAVQGKQLAQVDPEAARELEAKLKQTERSRRALTTIHAASAMSVAELVKAKEVGVTTFNKSTEFQNISMVAVYAAYLMKVNPGLANELLARMPPVARQAWDEEPLTGAALDAVADLYAKMYDGAAAYAIKATHEAIKKAKDDKALTKAQAALANLQKAAADPTKPFPWFWSDSHGWSMVERLPNGEVKKDWSDESEWVTGPYGRFMPNLRDDMVGTGTDGRLLFPNALTWGLTPQVEGTNRSSETLIRMIQGLYGYTIKFYHSHTNAFGDAAEYRDYMATKAVQGNTGYLDVQDRFGAGSEEVQQAIAGLDSAQMQDRLAALRKLRELEKQGVAIPVVGPALPSYVHVHSTASYPAVPGVVSPAHMVWAAHQAGAREIFLVDHETLLHIEEGFQAVKIVNDGVRQPLRAVYGVEFKAPVSPQRTALRAALQDGVAAGDAAWVVAWGVPVDADGKVSQGLVDLVGKFQAAKRNRAMDQALRLERELNDGFDLNSVLGLSPDRNITDRQLAYAAAQIGGKPADWIRKHILNAVPLSTSAHKFPLYEDVVTQLAQLGMVPTFTMQVKVPALENLVEELKKIGIQAFDIAGIEHHHADALDDVRTVIALAKKNSMPVLGGVDYRGDGAIGWPQAADWMKDRAITQGIEYLLTRPSAAVQVDDGLGNWMDRFDAGVEESNLRKAIDLGSICCFDFLENISDALIDAAIAGGATEFTMNPYSTGNYIQHLLTLTTDEGQRWAKKLYLLKEDAESWAAFKKELEGISKESPRVYKAIKAAMEPSPDVKPENERALAVALIKSMLAEARVVRDMLEKLAKAGKNGEQAYWEISKYFADKIAPKAKFVSIEVDPRLEREEFARSQAGQSANAAELQQWMVARMREQARELSQIAPNILVKVPNTPAGLATISEVDAHFNVTLTFADDDAREAIAAKQNKGREFRISPFVSRNAVYYQEFWGADMLNGVDGQPEADGHVATISSSVDTSVAMGPLADKAIWSSLGMKVKGDPGWLYAWLVVGSGILNTPPETARDMNRATFPVEKLLGVKTLEEILTKYFEFVRDGLVPSAKAKFPALMAKQITPEEQAKKAAAKWYSLINRPVDSARLDQVDARIGELEAAAGNKKRAFTREGVAIARGMLQAGQPVTEKTLMRLVLKKEGEEKFITPFQGAINLLQTTLDGLRKVAAGTEEDIFNQPFEVPDLDKLLEESARETQVVHAIARRSEYSRWKDLQIITQAKSGHPGGTLSAVEILETLYDPDVMRINPNDRAVPIPQRWLSRDRLVLSKGHAVPIQYVALANAGILTNAEIEALRKDPTNFAQGHATLSITPGIDFSTGALGYGAPAAAGMAVAAKIDGRDFHTFTVIGDGEMEKGPIYEMAQAARVMGLDNLTAIIDYNHYQQNYGREKYTPMDFDRLAAFWRLNDWNVVTIDGDHLADNVRYITELRSALIESKTRKNGKPTVILVKTIKGRGVSLTEGRFREGVTEFHGKALDAKQYEEATREIAPRLGIAVENRSLGDIEADLEKVGDAVRAELKARQLNPSKIDEINARNEVSEVLAKQARTTAQIIPLPDYQPGGKLVATREASGAAWTHYGSLQSPILMANGSTLDPTKIVLVSPSDLQDSESFKEFGKQYGIFSPNDPFGRLIEMGIMEDAGFKLAEGIAASGLGYLPVVGTFDRFVSYVQETLNHAAQDNLAMVVNASHGGSETGPDGTSQYSVQTPAGIYSLTDRQNRVEMFEPSDVVGTLTAALQALTSGKVAYLRLGRSPRPILDRSQAARVADNRGFTVWKEPAQPDITLVASGATVANALEAARILEGKGIQAAVVEVTSVTRIDDGWDEKEQFPWGPPAAPIYTVHDASEDSLRVPMLKAEASFAFSVKYPVYHRNLLSRGITVTGSGSTDTMFDRNRFTAAQIAEDSMAIVEAFRQKKPELIPAGIATAGVEEKGEKNLTAGALIKRLNTFLPDAVKIEELTAKGQKVPVASEGPLLDALKAHFADRLPKTRFDLTFGAADNALQATVVAYPHVPYVVQDLLPQKKSPPAFITWDEKGILNRALYPAADGFEVWDIFTGQQVGSIAGLNQPQNLMELTQQGLTAAGEPEVTLNTSGIAAGEPDALVRFSLDGPVDRIPGLKQPVPLLQLPDGRVLIRQENRLGAADFEKGTVVWFDLSAEQLATEPLLIGNDKILVGRKRSAGPADLVFVDTGSGQVTPILVGISNPIHLASTTDGKVFVAQPGSLALFNPSNWMVEQTVEGLNNSGETSAPVAFNGRTAVVPEPDALAVVSFNAEPGKAVARVKGLYKPKTPDVIADGTTVVQGETTISFVNLLSPQTSNAGIPQLGDFVQVDGLLGMRSLPGKAKWLLTTESGLKLMNRTSAGAEETAVMAVAAGDTRPARQQAIGHVLDAGLGWLRSKLEFDSPYLVVAEGLGQARALLEAGVPAARIVALVENADQRNILTENGFPGDNVLLADGFADWTAARQYAWRVAPEWLAALSDVEVTPLRTTARTVLGLVAQMKEMLPIEWQKSGLLTSESAETILRLYQVGV